MTRRIPARERAALAAYDALFAVFSLFYLPTFVAKGKHGAGFLERFGHVPSEARERLKGKRTLWIHAVSVGEVALAFRLAAEIRGRYEALLVTVTTAAGYEVASKIKDDEDVLLRFPVDFRGPVRRFVSAVNPAALVVLETEIWPNLIYELTKRGTPVYVVNARISDRAIGKYRLVKGFIGPVLRRLAGVGAQDEAMRARFVELGAEPSRVAVTGNMKFDWQPPAGLLGSATAAAERTLRSPGAPVVIAGSTHEGEEALVLEASRAAWAGGSRFTLLLAPRHLTRLEAAEAAVKKAGFMPRRLFDGGGAPASGDVFVLDRMGVLAGLYRAADVVFVGGSLVNVGGHNLVEPAYFEKAVVFGPHMQNFREMAAEFLGAGAAVKVGSAAELGETLAELSVDAERRRALGRAAKDIVGRHQGAVRRNVEAFLD